MKNTYETPLNSRYASPEMQYIFSPDRKFTTWRRLWVALAESEMELGLPVNQAQVELEQARYQSQADAECARLQNYLLEHRDDLPELTDNECGRIRSQLYSSVTCGVYLGGARGKILPKPLK